MPNVIRHLVDDPDEKLRDGVYGAGALIRTQSGAAVGGPFSDLSGTGSDPTVPIVSGQYTYLADDPSGTSATWYRTRFENSGGTVLSDWSAPFQVTAGLCSLASVKLRMFPAGVSDIKDDNLISELIDQVSGFIEQYTGRRFAPIASTDYYLDTVSGYVLRVPIGIRAVSFMGVNNLAHQPDTGGTYTTVPAADYLLRPRDQDRPPGWPFTEIWLSRGTLSGTVGSFGTIQNGCKLTMTAGFAATPADIQAVATDATIAAYQARKMGASGVIGANEGALVPWADFFGFGSPQRATLDRYRYMGLA